MAGEYKTKLIEDLCEALRSYGFDPHREGGLEFDGHIDIPKKKFFITTTSSLIVNSHRTTNNSTETVGWNRLGT